MAPGTFLFALSYAIESPAPVWPRLAGFALVTLGALAAVPAAARDLIRDAGEAVRPRSPADRMQLVALGAVTAAGTVVRATLLDVEARYDEAYTFLSFASVPLQEGMASYPLPNNHLLHTFLMHDAWRLLGDGLPALRLPAFLAGLALIPATWAAGRALYGPRSGLLAAALAAGSVPLIEYSVNARGYSMTWLAFVALIVLGARLIDRSDPAAWVLWTAVATLGLFTIPTMVLPLATVSAWVAISVIARGQPRRLLEVAAASVVTAVLSVLLYANVLGQAGWDWAPEPANDPLALAGDVWRLAHYGLGVVPQVLLAAAAVAGVLMHRRVARQPVPLPLAAALAIPVLVIALPRTPPFARSWLYVLPVELLAGAAGLVALAELARPRLLRAGPAFAVAIAVVLCVNVIVNRPPDKQDPPELGADEFASWVAKRPDTVVISSDFSIQSLIFHFRLKGARPIVTTGYAPPPPGAPAPLLAVSKTRGETLKEHLTRLGIGGQPSPRPRLVRRFGDLDVYSLAPR